MIALQVYCENCYRKNCQNDDFLQGMFEGCEGENVQSSLAGDLDGLSMNHGRIDREEASLRLREPLPDVPGKSSGWVAALCMTEVHRDTHTHTHTHTHFVCE